MGGWKPVALGEELAGVFHEFRLECSQFSNRLTEVNRRDVSASERDHPSEALFVSESCGVDSEPCPEHTVVGTGCSASLQVSESDDACFDPGPLFDQFGNDLANSTELDVSEFIEVTVLRDDSIGLRQFDTFADDHDAVHLAILSTCLEQFAHAIEVGFFFGDQEVVGGCRDSGEAGDPTGVSSHGLDHHHASMRFGSGSESIDGFHDDIDRGIETEGDIGAGEVVVDGLGDADGVDAVDLIELVSDTERVVSADCDQGIELVGPDRIEDELNGCVVLEGVGP